MTHASCNHVVKPNVHFLPPVREAGYPAGSSAWALGVNIAVRRGFVVMFFNLGTLRQTPIALDQTALAEGYNGLPMHTEIVSD